MSYKTTAKNLIEGTAQAVFFEDGGWQIDLPMDAFPTELREELVQAIDRAGGTVSVECEELDDGSVKIDLKKFLQKARS